MYLTITTLTPLRLYKGFVMTRESPCPLWQTLPQQTHRFVHCRRLYVLMHERSCSTRNSTRACSPPDMRVYVRFRNVYETQWVGQQQLVRSITSSLRMRMMCSLMIR